MPSNYGIALDRFESPSGGIICTEYDVSLCLWLDMISAYIPTVDGGNPFDHLGFPKPCE